MLLFNNIMQAQVCSTLVSILSQMFILNYFRWKKNRHKKKQLLQLKQQQRNSIFLWFKTFILKDVRECYWHFCHTQFK